MPCEPLGVKIKQKLKPQGPATAIVLTDAQVTELGGGKRAPITVTIGSKTVRLRLAVMGGQNLIGISKANREELGVEIGDTVDANAMRSGVGEPCGRQQTDVHGASMTCTIGGGVGYESRRRNGRNGA